MRILLICSLLFIISLTLEPAMARDLVGAAQAAQSQLNRIGVAALGIGVTAGGILYVLGIAHIGRYVLISAVMGAFCILGGPAIISLLSKIFV